MAPLVGLCLQHLGSIFGSIFGSTFGSMVGSMFGGAVGQPSENHPKVLPRAPEDLSESFFRAYEGSYEASMGVLWALWAPWAL